MTILVETAGSRPAHYAFDLRADGVEGWREFGDYVVWTSIDVGGPHEMAILEARPRGVVGLPAKTPLMHVVQPGVSHHIPGLFGAWRSCDADVVYLRSLQADKLFHVVIAGGQSRSYSVDTLHWICPKCATHFGHTRVPGGLGDPFALWERQIAIVRAFNADPRRRSCPGCGFVHPLGYGFRSAEDANDERAARGAW